MRKKNEVTNDSASYGSILNRVLSKKRRISLFGDVNKKSEQRIIKSLKAFNEENNEKIWLFINSLGGIHESGLRIAKAIRASRAPVYGVVIWKACSAAFDVLQACKKRIASNKKAIVMCHAPSLDDIRVDQTNRDKKIKKREKEHNDFLEYVVQRSSGKLSLEMMRELSRKEEDIFACRARRLGLLDRVMYKKKKKEKK